MNHNWNTYSKILRILGYKLLPTTSHGYLYFQHSSLGKITLEKKNKYDELTSMRYASLMRIALPYFEKIYNRCKE